MVYLLIRQQVKDFQEFKHVWDREAEPFLSKWNCLNARLCRSPENPTDIVVIHAFDRIDVAKKFMESEELKEKIKMAGGTGEVELTFLEAIDYKDFAGAKKHVAAA